MGQTPYLAPAYGAPSYLPPELAGAPPYSPAAGEPGPYGPAGYYAPTYLPPELLAGPPRPPADDLVDAVVALVEAALVPGTLGWFGTGEAPTGQGLPYACLDEPDESDDGLDTSGGMLSSGQLQVSCYAATKKAARLLGDRVRATLDDAPLAYAAGSHVFLRQASRSAGLDPDPAPGGGDCWQEVRLFHFTYSQSVGS